MSMFLTQEEKNEIGREYRKKIDKETEKEIINYIKNKTMEVVGKIKLIRNIQVVSDKFQKREFIVETNDQYPQLLQLELQGQNCDIIDAYKEGQEVSCSLNLRGRAWTNPQGEEKYFNTIVCWKIQPSNAPVGGTVNTAKTKTNPKEVVGNDDDGDLPF